MNRQAGCVGPGPAVVVRRRALSLLGNLADLGLGDIFQIVSLSRRSGTLQLTTPTESGEIVFEAGRVIAAYMTGKRESVGEGLLGLGVVPATTYQDMLAAQAAGGQGWELFNSFGLVEDKIADALEVLLKRAIFEMFEWAEGTFSFVLEDDPNPWRGFSLMGARVVVVRGLSPQYLAIEGARLKDERTKADALESFLARDKAKGSDGSNADVETFAAQLRDSPQPESSSAGWSSQPSAQSANGVKPALLAAAAAQPEAASSLAPAQPSAAPAQTAVTAPAPPTTARLEGPEGAEPSAKGVEVESSSADLTPPAEPSPIEGEPAAASSWRLLAVDDDPQVTKHILSTFGSRFSAVAIANTAAEALKEIDDDTPDLIVASDLIIARSDGAGILGGIEILEKVRSRSADVPVVLFTDYENVEAQNKADKLGVAGFLMKPRKAQIQAIRQKSAVSPAMQEFLDELGRALAPYIEAGAPHPEGEEPTVDLEAKHKELEAAEDEQKCEVEASDEAELVEAGTDRIATTTEAADGDQTEPDVGADGEIEATEVEADGEIEATEVEADGEIEATEVEAEQVEAEPDGDQARLAEADREAEA
ncbi:DUF4388 domain-containing protein, partial [Myxococcota bacterium]